MAFSTQAQIEAILGRSLTANELIVLSGIQIGVDGWIADVIGQDSFSSTPTTRTYQSDGQVLTIDPVRSISNVALLDTSGTTLYTYSEGTDYSAYPLNNSVKTHLVKLPYPNTLELYDGYSYAKWPSLYGKVAVTGTYGYADSTPADVVYVASYLCAKTFLLNSVLLSSYAGQIKSESIEGYSRTYADMSHAVESTVETLGDDDPVVGTFLSKYDGNEIYF